MKRRAFFAAMAALVVVPKSPVLVVLPKPDPRVLKLALSSIYGKWPKGTVLYADTDSVFTVGPS